MISILAHVRLNQATGKFSRLTMLLALVYALYGFAVPVMAQDQGWPRSIEKNGNEILIFQPELTNGKLTNSSRHARRWR